MGAAVFGVGNRYGGKQADGIGVSRMTVQFRGDAVFNHLAEIHDGGMVGDMPYHRKVMGDKQIGQVHIPLEPHQHIDDLCLNGYVQRRDRLVTDQKIGSSASARAMPTLCR